MYEPNDVLKLTPTVRGARDWDAAGSASRARQEGQVSPMMMIQRPEASRGRTRVGVAGRGGLPARSAGQR